MKKIIGWIKELDRYSLWPLFYPWAMSHNEQEAFDRIVKNSKEYLEFGSGGSTIRTLQKSKAKIYSVESSVDWIQFLKKYLIIRRFEGKRLRFFIVDIGPTQEWGYPVDNSSKHLFPSYYSDVFGAIDVERIDTILIDGRFRVACTLSVILQMYTFDTGDKTIILHDFWDREYYHEVLKYLDVLDKVDSLGVFKIKESMNISDVKKDFERFQFDPR